MNLGIVGSRSFTDYFYFKKVILEHIIIDDIDNIVSGGAKGADSLADKFCKEFLNKDPIVFEADWYNLDVKNVKVKYNKYGEAYNVLAGFNRNEKIVEYSDRLIAFWDGNSPGTANTIKLCEILKKPYIIINI